MAENAATMNEFLIKAVGLGAIRGERVLFSDLSVEAKAGEALVLRGANGAGKSTLLRMLGGLSRPDAGTVERPVRHHWIGHRNGLKPHETPRAHLTHWGRVWGSTADAIEIASHMGIERPFDVAGRLLSAGQKRRTAIARLLLADRPLWLLDEPFSALDTQGKALVTSLIDRHRASGGAVITALHGEAPFEASGEVQL
ncbi:heme ABC exporter ATP-binding protein CcmA [Henriciella marina]|uniref:Heme ABC exporter ATP-binding protein CcmA n=1 Tax=Henriciella marina TaxID=453851 RepID=A0ABT4LQL5_9PROT|nr:heme ABC exporter ATP-binding protein CcmA [Henriciella marina]MCZ4296611.1 heme ABC exporter ATP-binding protein CcmA [Henriciella marina]